MRRAWDAWVALWDRREPPTALALARIALGLVVLRDLIDVRQSGLVEALWSYPPDGYAVPYLPWLPVDAHVLWTIGALAAFAVTIGAATRVACVVLALASARMGHLAPDSESAFDMVLRIAMIVLAMSKCNARWSIDAAIGRALGRPPPTEIPAWPRILLMLQVVWIYFSGGHNKTGAEWGPLGGFTALAHALGDPHVARFDPTWIATAYPLLRVATAATMVFELGAPLYLLLVYYAETADRPGRLRAAFNRWRLRWAWFGLGIAFELGIATFLKIGDFPWGMLALYPVLLLPSDYRRKTLAPANRASSPS